MKQQTIFRNSALHWGWSISMKITKPEGLPQVPPQINTTKAKQTETSEFARALQKAAQAKSPAGAMPLTPQRLAEPRPVSMPTAISNQPSILSKAQEVIDLMDFYANSLSDPQKSLKDIEPALNSFVNEAENVHNEYTQNTKTSGELTRILDDLRRAARLEQIRFRRGDYLDSE
jgi:hypothetical protein